MSTYFKRKKIVSKKARQSARGERCTLQTPFCGGRTDTVVLCHAPSESKGTGTKSDDFWGAFGCSKCHDFLDGRKGLIPNEAEARFYWMRGIYRTLQRQFDKGVFTV